MIVSLKPLTRRDSGADIQRPPSAFQIVVHPRRDESMPAGALAPSGRVQAESHEAMAWQLRPQQVCQRCLAGFLGFGEGLKGRARDPYSASVLMDCAP